MKKANFHFPLNNFKSSIGFIIMDIYPLYFNFFVTTIITQSQLKIEGTDSYLLTLFSSFVYLLYFTCTKYIF